MRRRGLFVASFLESLAVILLERGIYFYTEEVLAFTKPLNLWLGLLFGVCYVTGALVSHTVSARTGERRALLGAVVGQMLLLILLMLYAPAWVIWAAFACVGILSGFMWPIIESYTTAGLVARQMLKMVGRFCIAWSLAVPIGVAITGPLLASGWPGSLFAVGIICHIIAYAILARLPATPIHTPHDHPDQPDPARMTRYIALLVGSRWLLLGGYAMLFLLAPLLPYILKDHLGLSTQWATPFASVMDLARIAAFAGLGWFTFWYGRASPLLLSVLLLPVGFLLILLGDSLVVVLVGEALFGLFGGLVYFASLYYSLASKNASVKAGGGHEALIGGGFALGPLCGLVGLALKDHVPTENTAMLLGASPLILMCIVGGTLPLLKLLRPQPR